MIYLRNNKLLVKAGKLCRSCCGVTPGEDCLYCDSGKTPLNLKLIFSGLENCVCNKWFYYEGGWYYGSSVGIAESINGHEFIIPQLPDDFCQWADTFPGEWGHWDNYGRQNYGEGPCETLDYTNEITNLGLYVRKLSISRIVIGLYINCPPAGGGFIYDGEPTITKCVNCEVDNQLTSCDTAVKFFGGSVLIEEVT